MRMKTLACAALAACYGFAVAHAQAPQMPAGWKYLSDPPSSSRPGPNPAPEPPKFGAMPPGWHITSTDASVLYHPDYMGRGNFSVEMESFLFPGDSTSEYGIFLGGTNLAGSQPAVYVAFVARRDGQAAILRRGGAPVVDWKANTAVVAQTGETEAKNVLRVDVNAADVVFSANGKEIAKVPRAGLALDGPFGFRIGKSLNIHASRLDVTHRLAPVPVK